ncbi:MAG: CinA family nicotinamide mononucleotide deamidase-related protein [Candidatus Omnitrophota bacterium]
MTLQASVLTIGNELLQGHTLNTNSRFLSAKLTQAGFRVVSQIACDDEIGTIKKQLGAALASADVVLVTGGLGPTPDDVTRDAIADYFKVKLRFSPAQYRKIEASYAKYGGKVPALVKKEACYPDHAAPLLNAVGIALGFSMRVGRKTVVVLPGVPSELENMYEASVKKLLAKRYPDTRPRPHLTIKAINLSEPRVMQLLGKDFFDQPFKFGIYPEAGQVIVRCSADRPRIIEILRKKAVQRLGEDIYALEEISLEEVLGKLLTARKRTVAVAESCTGGLLAAKIAQVPGASRYFKGGVIAYSNSVKEKLGVDPRAIRSQGAVSGEVASQMASRIRERWGTDYGVGITGIAGPGGGTREKPVGSVYLALATKRLVIVRKELFWGDRPRIQQRAVMKAMGMLWQDLRYPRRK